MNSAPKISVVVPVYKADATLPRCIESVLAQTYRDFELLLVDDGSPDKAGEICDEYAARYDFVRVVHKQNAGVAEARKTGVHNALGEFIVALDSDDALPAHALETHIRNVEKYDLDLCYGVFNYIKDGKGCLVEHPLTGVMTPEEFLIYNLNINGHCGSTANICRKSAWTDDVFPSAGKRFPSEDILINARLANNIRRAGVFNDYVEDYYYVPTSLSVAGTLWSLDNWSAFFDELRGILVENGKLTSQMEFQIREMEVHHLGFYVFEYQSSHPWQRRVMGYSMAGHSRKTRLLRALLRAPRLLKRLIAANRWVKRKLLRRVV